ncbi:TIGR01777 family oxidoreductase [Balneolaceae bacterium ANBcel3]|nr:TIGR01777 family oxidoreductase [Balneolaceae bacterium ANBcel3]
MQAILFGGTGFIGRNLAQRLAGIGYKITIVSRNPEKHTSEAFSDSGAITLVHLREDMTEDIDGNDIVINLAGESLFGKRWTSGVKERLYKSRIETTRKIVHWMSNTRKKPGLFISSSAVGYYGDTGSRSVDEGASSGTGFLANICKDWEKAALDAEKDEIRVVIPRTGIVLGIDGGALATMSPAFKWGLGATIGPGSQYFPWIHMDDYCESIIYAIGHKEFQGPFNASGPQPVTMNVFTRSLGKLMRRPAIFYIPAWFLKGVLGEASTMLTQSSFVIPQKLTKSGFEFKYPELKMALKQILAE